MSAHESAFIRAVAILIVLLVAATAEADRLQGATEAIERRVNFVDLSFVPAYQRSLRDPGETGNYTIDIISKLTLLEREPELIGNTDVVFWVNSSDKFSGMNSTAKFSSNAGVIFQTNDIGNDSSNTSLLVLGLSQTLFYERVEIGLGKYFPGQSVMQSSYLGDNSNTFQSKMLSSNRIPAEHGLRR